MTRSDRFTCLLPSSESLCISLWSFFFFFCGHVVSLWFKFLTAVVNSADAFGVFSASMFC